MFTWNLIFDLKKKKLKKKKQRDEHFINVGHLNDLLPRLWCKIEYEIIC